MTGQDPHSGRFQAGNRCSRGRPRRAQSIAEAVRKLLGPEEAAQAVLDIARSETADIDDRLAAWKLLLAYGWGTPVQTVEQSGPGGGPIEHRITIHRAERPSGSSSAA